MNGSNEKDMLARELRDRAEHVGGHPITFDGVKDGARRIQRRRRVVSGAVAAAVIAVAVPVGLQVTDLTRSTAPAPANPSPSVTRTDEPTPSPTPSAPKGPIMLDGAAAPRGADPTLTYLSGSVVHTADGTSTDLGGNYGEIAPYQSGWVGIDWAANRTYYMDAQGRSGESHEGIGLAVDTEGVDLVDTVSTKGGSDLILTSTDGSRKPPLTTTVAESGTVTPVGFVGDQRVLYTVDRGSDGTAVAITDFEGKPTVVDGLVNAQGANEVTGVFSGMTSANDSETCSAVVVAATGERKWETCEYQLTTYSPDGRYVLGLPSYFDGLGYSTFAILDASDGTVVAEFETGRDAFVSDSVWESDSTSLSSVYSDGTWYMLRMRPDGSVEQAVDPLSTGDEMTMPWRFASTP